MPDDYTFHQKSFSVSTVVGGKMFMPGHRLRHELWKIQEQISVQRRFFTSMHGGPKSDLVLGKSKSPLFDSQFHVAIENCVLPNYFTEKVVDCFRTKSVPIYLGCPNIGDYFNVDGMVIVSSPSDIVTACNSLTDSTYDRMRDAIEDNYVRSERFKDLSGRLGTKITELLKY